MLLPGKTRIFAMMSIFLHVAFAVLFAKVTLSFPPPPAKRLSLLIMTREGVRGEIIQNEAAWPIPHRIEPDFSVDDALEPFGTKVPEWIDYQMPPSSIFEPRETLTVKVDLKELAARAYEPPPEEFFSHLPPEMKPMPVTDFAIGPGVPRIFETD